MIRIVLVDLLVASLSYLSFVYYNIHCSLIFSATLVDTVTSLAGSSRNASGVSVNLNINYISAANPGDTLIINAKVSL